MIGGAVLLPCSLFVLRHPGTGAYKLLGGVRSYCQNGSLLESSCQWVLFSTSTTGVLVPTVIHSHSLPPQETFQHQQVGLAHASVKSLLFPWVLVSRDLHVPFKSGVLISLSLVEFLQSGPTGLQSQMLWGFFLLITDPQTWELRTFIFVGETLS